jgi:N-acyl homoserine lactone hydrolase
MNVSTLKLQSNGSEICIHALSTGTMRLKSACYEATRPYALRIPRILLSSSWGEPIPVGVFVIEHPEGVVVVDTGESISARDPAYFQRHGFNGWFNGRILNVDIDESEELPAQLNSLGIQPDDVTKIVLTHLHVDHTDGLKFLPGAECIVAQREHEKPIGVVPQNFPDWFKPRLIQHSERDDSPFERCFPVTASGDIVAVPTPGHTPGHQSVVVRTPDLHVFLAGDVSRTQDQVKNDEFSGLTASIAASGRTYGKVREYCASQATVYLPSHDEESKNRLANKTTFAQ